MHVCKAFKKLYAFLGSVIVYRGAPDLHVNYTAPAGCYRLMHELCLCWPLIEIVFHTPCTWNDYPSHLSSRRGDLRLYCWLAQALMPLESIANLSSANTESLQPFPNAVSA